MDSAILTEAFKKLDILDEAAFDLNSDSEIDDARDFLTDITIDDSIDIVDPDAESEDEVGESFIGKVILECNVCHSKIFEDEEDVSIDEESGAANVGTECPYCFSVDGYSIIGQVAPMGQVRDELEVKEEETVEEDPIDKKQLGEALKKYRRGKLRESRRSRKRLHEAKGANAEYLMYCLKNHLIDSKEALLALIKTSDEFAIEDALLDMGLKDKMDEKLREAKSAKKKRLKESEDGDDEDILFDAREDLIDYLNSHTDYSWDANEMYDNCAVAESDDDYIEVFVDIDENGNTSYTVNGDTYSTLAEVVENLPELYSYDDDDLDESCKNPKKKSKKIAEGINGKRVVQVSMDVIIPEDQSGDDVIEVIERNCPELYIAGTSSDYDMTDQYADDPSWFEDRSEADDFEAIKAGAEEFARQFSPRNEDVNGAAMKKGECKNDALTEGEEVCPECGKEPCECGGELDEDFKDVSITTDDTHMEMTSDEDGKITVTSEPVTNEDDFGDGEMLAPVDMETKDNLMAELEPEDEEEVDIDFDEFDEEGFDELGESYLKKIYENVNSFKTSKVQEQGNGLKIEGLIEFSSGNTKKTSFLFEAKDIDRKGKIRLIGENKEITRGKKAFTITGSMKDKKFMCESLRYNYRAKDENGKSTRLYGTMKRSK